MPKPDGVENPFLCEKSKITRKTRPLQNDILCNKNSMTTLTVIAQLLVLCFASFSLKIIHEFFLIICFSSFEKLPHFAGLAASLTLLGETRKLPNKYGE